MCYDSHGVNPSRMNEAAAWHGRIWRSSGAAVFQGRGGPTATHAHPAYKFVLGARVEGATAREGNCLLVPPGSPHVVAADDVVTLVYLDARVYDVDAARRLGARLARAGARSDFEAMSDDVRALPTTAHESEVRALLERFMAGERRGDIARWLGRSTSHVTHRVSGSTGIALRAWRTWSRVLHSVDLIGHGATVTEAAHEAGFADSPHLWRQCRSTLGISPSTLAGSRFVFAR